jgi:hypothetical protein
LKATLLKLHQNGMKMLVDQVQEEPSTASKAWPRYTVTPDSTAASDGYTLSDLDMVMPDSLVGFFLVYELRPDHDIQRIIRSFQQGLNKAAEKLPPLAAKIRFDSGGKPLKQLARGSLQLQIRMFELGDHKSFDQLAEREFSPYDFDRLRLLPKGAFDVTNEKPVCIVQLNLIPGGLILGLGFNHVATDGGGIYLATKLICQCSKTSMEASSVPRFRFHYQRDVFAPPPEPLVVPREQLMARVNDYQISDIAATTNGKNSMNGTKASEKNPVAIKGLIYRIEGSAAQRLKDSCKPSNGLPYVSTYDCIVGMLWKSILRIRAALKPHLSEGKSRLLHSVDLRKRPGQGIPDNYFGNAVSVPSVGPVQMTDLLGPNGLSFAASSIRQSIENTTMASIANVTALGAMLAPTEKLLFRPSGGLLEENLMISSWYFMNIANYDIGIGPPSTLRSWAAPIPGFLVLFPDCKRQQNSRVYDFYVALLEGEQDMLSKDEDFRSWFQVV